MNDVKVYWAARVTTRGSYLASRKLSIPMTADLREPTYLFLGSRDAVEVCNGSTSPSSEAQRFLNRAVALLSARTIEGPGRAIVVEVPSDLGPFCPNDGTSLDDHGDMWACPECGDEW